MMGWGFSSNPLLWGLNLYANLSDSLKKATGASLYDVNKMAYQIAMPAALGYVSGGILGGAAVGASVTGTVAAPAAGSAAAAAASLGASIGSGVGGAVQALQQEAAVAEDKKTAIQINQDKIDLARAHNRESYKANADMASLQLNEQQRSDAIGEFQKQSAAEAGLGASGLEGGTPFWALKLQSSEAMRQIGAAFTQGTGQLDQMGETARYNEANFNLEEKGNNLDSAALARDMAWAPINAIMKGVQVAYGMSGIIDNFGNLFAKQPSFGLEKAAGIGTAMGVSGTPTTLLRKSSVSPYSSLSLGSNGYGSMSLGQVGGFATSIPKPIRGRSPLAWN
jgi:hypothetical protein